MNRSLKEYSQSHCLGFERCDANTERHVILGFLSQNQAITPPTYKIQCHVTSLELGQGQGQGSNGFNRYGIEKTLCRSLVSHSCKLIYQLLSIRL